MAVDWLRSCYSSKFYYSSSPPLSLVGKYSFAAPDAEMLPSPNPYASSIWLKEYEVGQGLGDSLEDFTWVAGSPLDPGIKNKSKEVLPLLAGCGTPYDVSYPMAGAVSDGVPTACWRVPPGRHGSYSYRVFVPYLRYDDGSGPRDFSGDFLLAWDTGIGWNSSGYLGSEGAAMLAYGSYPDGSGWELSLSLHPSLLGRIVNWIFLLREQQEDFTVEVFPDFNPGVTILAMEPVQVAYVHVPDGWPVDPADIYP